MSVRQLTSPKPTEANRSTNALTGDRGDPQHQHEEQEEVHHSHDQVGLGVGRMIQRVEARMRGEEEWQHPRPASHSSRAKMSKASTHSSRVMPSQKNSGDDAAATETAIPVGEPDAPDTGDTGDTTPHVMNDYERLAEAVDWESLDLVATTTGKFRSDVTEELFKQWMYTSRRAVHLIFTLLVIFVILYLFIDTTWPPLLQRTILVTCALQLLCSLTVILLHRPYFRSRFSSPEAVVNRRRLHEALILGGFLNFVMLATAQSNGLARKDVRHSWLPNTHGPTAIIMVFYGVHPSRTRVLPTFPLLALLPLVFYRGFSVLNIALLTLQDFVILVFIAALIYVLDANNRRWFIDIVLLRQQLRPVLAMERHTELLLSYTAPRSLKKVTHEFVVISKTGGGKCTTRPSIDKVAASIVVIRLGGYSEWLPTVSPEVASGTMVNIIDEFDQYAVANGLWKVWCNGDEYVVGGNLPDPCEQHAAAACRFALAAHKAIWQIMAGTSSRLFLRVGIATGKASAVFSCFDDALVKCRLVVFGESVRAALSYADRSPLGCTLIDDRTIEQSQQHVTLVLGPPPPPPPAAPSSQNAAPQTRLLVGVIEKAKVAPSRVSDESEELALYLQSLQMQTPVSDNCTSVERFQMVEVEEDPTVEDDKLEKQQLSHQFSRMLRDDLRTDGATYAEQSTQQEYLETCKALTKDLRMLVLLLMFTICITSAVVLLLVFPETSPISPCFLALGSFIYLTSFLLLQHKTVLDVRFPFLIEILSLLVAGRCLLFGILTSPHVRVLNLPSTFDLVQLLALSSRHTHLAYPIGFLSLLNISTFAISLWVSSIRSDDIRFYKVVEYEGFITIAMIAVGGFGSHIVRTSMRSHFVPRYLLVRMKEISLQATEELKDGITSYLPSHQADAVLEWLRADRSSEPISVEYPIVVLGMLNMAPFTQTPLAAEGERISRALYEFTRLLNTSSSFICQGDDLEPTPLLELVKTTGDLIMVAGPLDPAVDPSRRTAANAAVALFDVVMRFQEVLALESGPSSSLASSPMGSVLAQSNINAEGTTTASNNSEPKAECQVFAALHCGAALGAVVGYYGLSFDLFGEAVLATSTLLRDTVQAYLPTMKEETNQPSVFNTAGDGEGTTRDHHDNNRGKTIPVSSSSRPRDVEDADHSSPSSAIRMSRDFHVLMEEACHPPVAVVGDNMVQI